MSDPLRPVCVLSPGPTAEPTSEITDGMVKRAAIALADEIDGGLAPETVDMWQQAARRALSAALTGCASPSIDSLPEEGTP